MVSGLSGLNGVDVLRLVVQERETGTEYVMDLILEETTAWAMKP